MAELLLWAARIVVVAIFVLLLAVVFRFFQLEDESERQEYGDAGKPFFKQNVEVGSHFGPKSKVPRWQAWLGALAIPIGILVVLMVSSFND